MDEVWKVGVFCYRYKLERYKKKVLISMWQSKHVTEGFKKYQVHILDIFVLSLLLFLYF